MHVHAEKASDDDTEALRIRLGIDRDSCGDIGQLAARHETPHRFCRK
jgi:hypothetical protein